MIDYIAVGQIDCPDTILKDAVMSPGGTTAAGYGALEDGGTRAACIHAIEKAHKRAKELSCVIKT